MPFHCIRCKREIDKSYMACPHCGEPVTDFLRRYADEPIDGKYQIVERLGAGGMGEVYKVTHTYLGATRVIKVIRPQISESQDAHERFLREARAATKIQHPNVATLHDFSALPDGSHYMVWEFIDGENVAQRIRARGRLQPRYAVRLAIQALHGLEAIHRAGIVHRDVSPENLMITREEDERVKVIDLGVAKMEEAGEAATRVGIFVGKLRYASPEHLGFLGEGERIDGRADLFSLAMVLYEMLTGRPPFEATSPHEYVMLHSREQQFKPLDLPPDLPGGAQLQAVLAKALDRDRNKRFASAREFAAALEEVERSLPDPNAMQTMHLQTFDADATWIPTPLPELEKARGQTDIDTLHRDTVRSGVGEAPPTIRTPLPPLASTGSVAGQAGATLQTPLPGGAPTAHDTSLHGAPVVPRTRHGSFAAFAIIGLILLLAGAAIALLFVGRRADRATTVSIEPAPEAANPVAPIVPSETTVDVVTETATPQIVNETAAPNTTTTASPALSATTAAPPAVATVAPRVPVSRPPAAAVTPPQPAPVPVPVPQPPPAPAVRSYIDGDDGDADVNDQLIANARRELAGVQTVAVRGSGEMFNDLVNRIQRQHGLTISDNADVVIEFDGALERLGRGRKRRSADATIRKSGRVIFRYTLPGEVYRVGDTPAEAFSRVISDVFGR